MVVTRPSGVVQADEIRQSGEQGALTLQLHLRGWRSDSDGWKVMISTMINGLFDAFFNGRLMDD